MSELTVRQFADKAYQAEIILALMQEKTAVRMEDSEIDALIAMVKDLIGDVGGFLGEEASREEEENA
ncbi:hypothetical protein RZP29_29375 [Klebsiella quasipneumoniae subsp. similipneumoniae]|uniref:Uncharacterized protein n=1 Tax=Klebsiella quasipneumoniae subsp. similipneumoniae TaxID=1463164 RepID=A0AAE4SLL8_9ENTR|nr:hypothetical protein [Klebsiella quasipneumoniae]MDV0614633.1 hypothetical protein [Klebsiella quasipneumoniae subsp. similipneumoniae]MDV0642401.1 hypothetical protein [Klebsiella quasipneumoniae subsp. similipneumoniae]MDV0729539.1 hypothetical protein [Klebsiella quasipneumoniae subsp. similipneumoniae]MDV0740919.1 hypothetical protein [Klebsiella quasipneumoniae subsp. similipneumoniae]MDV0766852.1 hypothetical protein [Klebsiella quasipneumoniae subsp. similipneumoniae]